MLLLECNGDLTRLSHYPFQIKKESLMLFNRCYVGCLRRLLLIGLTNQRPRRLVSRRYHNITGYQADFDAR